MRSHPLGSLPLPDTVPTGIPRGYTPPSPLVTTMVPVSGAGGGAPRAHAPPRPPRPRQPRGRDHGRAGANPVARAGRKAQHALAPRPRLGPRLGGLERV